MENWNAAVVIIINYNFLPLLLLAATGAYIID